MASGRIGITKDYVKQAYQRARRLAKGPVRALTGSDNPALNMFLKNMAKVNKSKKMSKEQKAKTREAVAKAFIQSGMSTRTEIQTEYAKIVPRTNERTRQAIQNDPNLMAKYLEGNKNQRIAIVGSYYLQSSQFREAHMRVLTEGLHKQNFYEFINEATIDKQLHPDLSNAELNAAIQDYNIIHEGR